MTQTKRTVGIYTLGCKVNQYESEAIAERFTAEGFFVQAPTLPCDIYVINTCTVTGESDRKARQFIRRAIHKNPSAFILVTGCFSQVAPERVASIEGVDFICGNAAKLSVVDAAKRLVEEGKKPSAPQIADCPPDAHGFEAMEISHFDRTRAYVKIEDGCESRCTYCIIPTARGAIRSKPAENVLCEVSRLSRGGCREIVLTGIETASWGKDLGNQTLADLLCLVDKIPDIGRIRLGSLDPSLMKEAFVSRIAGLSSLAPHFHISMQSGSDRILALMKRKYNTKMALEGIERLRRAIPDVQLTTDMIVGFPGETEEDFLNTVEFAKKARFLMIHVFPYSKRAGTPAAQMDHQVPEEVKHARVKRLIEVAEEIRFEILSSLVGRCEDVLFETFDNGQMHGHTKGFVEVRVPARDLHGQIHSVLITSADKDGCIGELVKPQNER